jgi:hypothetical protein
MTESSPYPDSNGDGDVRPGRGSTPGRPRWVKVLGSIAGVLVLVFVVLHLAGGGMGGHH